MSHRRVSQVTGLLLAKAVDHRISSLRDYPWIWYIA
jgi:hypothetical protein